MLKLEKNGENRASQKDRAGEGGGEREDFFFLPSPSLLSFFCPSTYPSLPLGLLFLLSLIFLRHKMAVTTVRT